MRYPLTACSADRRRGTNAGKMGFGLDVRTSLGTARGGWITAVLEGIGQGTAIISFNPFINPDQ